LAAQEIKLSADTEAEFNPHVVIIANDPEKFQDFAELLSKSGFPAQVIMHPESELLHNPRPGTIFYVSFNLKATESVTLARRIEQQLGLHCIVFAEQEGTETAAKLSSAKMSHTLQFPYTKKNFLMAVKLLVNQRKAQFEKDKRQQNMKERRKGAAEHNLVFPGENDAVIIQKGQAQSATQTKVIKGDGRAAQVLHARGIKTQSFSFVNKGNSGETTVIIQNSEPALQAKARPLALEKPVSTAQVQAAEPAVQSPQKNHQPPVFALKPILTEAKTQALASEPSPTQPLTADQENKVEIASAPAAIKSAASANQSQYSNETFWAILVTAFLGSLICLYCLYQILWNGGFS